MSGLPKEKLQLLQEFVQLCKHQPDVLYSPELVFYKHWLESLGARIPVPEPKAEEHGCCGGSGDKGGSSHRAGSSHKAEEPAHVEEMESEEESPESDLDVDEESKMEPEKEALPALPPYSEGLEVSDEMSDKCDERKVEAMEAANDGRVEDAVRLYGEAIGFNPTMPVLYAKRAQLFLRLQRPSAAIQDADRALLINPDSAPALKQRGRARRLLGLWEEAFNDLTLAQKIDYDDGTQEAIKQLQPKIKKIQEHKLKHERKRADRDEKERLERLRRAREAQEKAREAQERRQQQQRSRAGGFPGAGGMPGGGGGGGMPFGLEQLFSDPELLTMMQDPEVAAAFKDITQNPANIMKHQSNPKVAKLLEKLGAKFGPPPPGSGDDDVDDDSESPPPHGGPFSSGGGGGPGAYSTADVD